MATSSDSASSLPTVFDPATLVSKGLITVAKDRAVETHRIYYELHGAKTDVKERLLLVMGLNMTSFGWIRQVRHFARREGTQVLVLDNRGVGNSDLAKGLYKTSEMALDVKEVLDSDEVGWTGEKSLTVVGVSMGGMISQHLSLLIPERIHSLMLLSSKTSTSPDLPPLKGLLMFSRLIIFGRLMDDRKRINAMVDNLFPASYLDQYDEETDIGGRKRKRREVAEEDFWERFVKARKQPPKGSLSQVAAALGHKISREQCKEIADKIEKIMVVSGEEDMLIHHQRTLDMAGLFDGCEVVVFKDTGHAIPYQHPDRLNELIEKLIVEGRAKVKTA